MAKHIDGQDVLAHKTLDKLRVFAQLLARQAARQTLEHPSTVTLTTYGRSNTTGPSVVFGTATCT
jgi:hypothetical protein